MSELKTIAATTEDPKRINYESDFTHVTTFVHNGQPTNVPDYDFNIEVFTSGSKKFTAKRVNGICSCCRVSGNKIETFVQEHGLPPGDVNVRLAMYRVNPEFKGSRQKVVSYAFQGSVLVAGNGDDDVTIIDSATLGYAIVDAYDMAVKAGYKGSCEDYMAALATVGRKQHVPSPYLHRKSISINSFPGERYSGRYIKFPVRQEPYDISKIRMFLQEAGGEFQYKRVTHPADNQFGYYTLTDTTLDTSTITDLSYIKLYLDRLPPYYEYIAWNAKGELVRSTWDMQDRHLYTPEVDPNGRLKLAEINLGSDVEPNMVTRLMPIGDSNIAFYVRKNVRGAINPPIGITGFKFIHKWKWVRVRRDVGCAPGRCNGGYKRSLFVKYRAESRSGAVGQWRYARVKYDKGGGDFRAYNVTSPF